jgi:hypothetical protein
VAQRPPAHLRIHFLVDEVEMNRQIHELDSFRGEAAAWTPTRTAPEAALHLCPFSKRIVDCIDNCEHCAAINARLETDFREHVQSRVFGGSVGPATRFDAGVDEHFARGLVIWLLDVTERWSSRVFWSVAFLAGIAFWAIAIALMVRI